MATNQIAQFDMAFQSRIYLRFKYGDLNKDQTVAIFEQLLAQYISSDVVDDCQRLMKCATTELHKKGSNGRPLRNITTSTIAYACFFGKKMGTDHGRHVVCRFEVFQERLGLPDDAVERDAENATQD